MATLYYESSFAHHGVKGQKWGVRRYQNPDGTLTAKGRVHKAKTENRENLKNAKKENSIERGQSIADRKHGITGRMTKHATDIAVANTASGFGMGVLKGAHESIKNERNSILFRPGYGGKPNLHAPKFMSELSAFDGMHLDKLNTAMDVVMNSATTLAVGTAVFNAYKGAKIVKDAYDYHNYKKSKKS